MTGLAKHRLKTAALLGSLYISQYIPLTFIYEALPAFVRQQGMSLETIGLLPLVALPTVFKFLWAPAIDRYGFTQWGHYRFWIIGFQLLAIASAAIAADLSPARNFPLVLGAMFALCLWCASQDIATDALAVGVLTSQERGWGNGIQLSGNYLGAAVGGGGMLVLLDWWGWKPSMLILTGLMLVALLPIFNFRETCVQKNDISQFVLLDLVRFCRRPQIWRWLIVLTLFSTGPMVANTMFRPLLVDIGLSMTEIGLLLGALGYAAGIFGAIAAGLLVTRLGRWRSLLWFCSLRVFAIATYLLPALGVVNLPLLYGVAIAFQFTNGMAMTALFTLMMDRSKLTTPGTDFTLQTSFIYFGGLLTAPLSGFAATSWGYQGAFALALTLALGSVVSILGLVERNLASIESI
ncbi:MFS transporter [Roseofilum casamattae]|uniref:MFS transporter n=1 Tax=Roseofilum casamattae BLCC-M143 TaxID=3022442 RepID=A0ABT7BYG2_9CYAN|nr:MFS transporter [Roseofilum casamattae]MDJ1184225.1 MFS transporter [Roseofilum casamattae BLCC-M143]